MAVIDSGIEEHPDLHKNLNPTASRIIARYDFTGELSSLLDPHDRYGHGTHVAGIIAGNGALSLADNDGEPYTGIAPKANLVDLRVLGADGTGTVAGLLRALHLVLKHADRYGIRVVNLSVGTAPSESYETDPLCRAVAELVDAGITVVVAAGNHGKDENGTKRYGGILSPANDPKVLTVGAVNTRKTDDRDDDIMTTYSSRGPTISYRAEDTDGDGTASEAERRYDNLIKPDLVAPGNRIVSTAGIFSSLVAEHPELIVDDHYIELSGTSMAAPVVSGIVALLYQQHPDLTPALIKAVLMYTAQRVPDANVLEQGAGLVNARAAYDFVAEIVAAPGDLAAGEPAAPGLDLTQRRIVSEVGDEDVRWARQVLYVDGWYFGGGLYRSDGIRFREGATDWTGLLSADGVIYGRHRTVASSLGESTNHRGDAIVWANGVLWTDVGLAPVDIRAEAARLGASGILWADGILWGDGVVFSDGLLCADGLLWADGYLMPDGILWGDGVLWADGILWGDGVLWADSVLWADCASRAD